MASISPNQIGSQFFITLTKATWLDTKHLVIGTYTLYNKYNYYILNLKTLVYERVINVNKENTEKNKIQTLRNLTIYCKIETLTKSHKVIS